MASVAVGSPVAVHLRYIPEVERRRSNSTEDRSKVACPIEGSGPKRVLPVDSVEYVHHTSQVFADKLALGMSV